MTITVTYNPPPPPPPPPPVEQGTVTITMDAALANKLQAMLGHCNGFIFDALHTKLLDALKGQPGVEVLKMIYRPGADEEGPLRLWIDLQKRHIFVKR